MITPKELEVMEAVASKVTSGPWVEAASRDYYNSSRIECKALGVIADGLRPEYARFIVEAQTNYAGLIAEVKRLRECLGFYSDKLNFEEKYDTLPCGCCWGFLTARAIEDCGARAREALGEE